MEDDGFTRVWRSKKQRTAGTAAGKGGRKTAPCPSRVDGDATEVEEAMRRANERMEKDGGELLAWTRREMDKALRGRPVAQVLILGNGNFDGALEPGAAQLALALRVAESFPSASLHFQDPQCTAVECDWLRARRVDVRSGQDMQPPQMHNEDAVRLVFFIHNPHGLMEELLSSDWESGGTARSVLLCNDYGGWTADEFEQSIDGRMPATCEFVRQAKIVRLPTYEPFPSAFHHTALIYQPEDVQLQAAVN
ncbi:hypothetical protein PFISCL1PPCAC_13040 [Pristionchus fissidentatus]|uniref:SRR1-like domain-containing protein n=1 Tax=Pristionchus fissidentatus TaxID=1538716 RepID=A0AAV5VTQ2_9BILA|nr:hypothetical protein PFISCL1PPCAC_13040 [Pristionchus fissidentatus]